MIEATGDENGLLYRALRHQMTQSALMKDVPDTLRTVIRKEAWKHWKLDNRDFEAATLVEYLTGHPPQGIGATLDLVRRIVEGDVEVEQALREETTAPAHVHKGDSDNVTISDERGNGRAYTLDRLKREAPELFQRVVAGELSANAAAIEAGFRSPPVHWSKDPSEHAQQVAERFPGWVMTKQVPSHFTK